MILEGKLKGLEGYAVGRMTKSRRGKLYIDDAGWGPEAGSIEYGYRVPFGGIHVFIGRIGKSGPELDVHTNLRVGYRANFFSSKVNDTVTHIYNHSFVIGISGEWLSFNPRKPHTKKSKIISPIF